MKRFTVLAAATAFLVVVAAVVMSGHWKATNGKKSAGAIRGASAAPETRWATVDAPRAPSESPASPREPKDLPGVESPKIEPVKSPAQVSAPPGRPQRQKPPIQDPVARAALSWVGLDSSAEQYWLDAINDPSLPAEERKDLIEDLNEDGLSNPNKPGVQDIPLIMSRLQLIEAVGPYSMDQVNADAFQEAYKDLVKMLNGDPVQ